MPECTPPTVLIVEDELPLRTLLSMLLRDEGFCVRTAANGREGLATIERDGEPDIALVDLMMPVLDGRGFLAEARKRGCRFPAILVSASPEAQAIADEMACEVLPKPYEFADLVARVRTSLAA